MGRFSHIISYFQKDKISAYLSKEELEAFLYERKIIQIKKGKKLLKENHTPNGVYYIHSGKAKLYKVGATGKEQIIRFLTEGDLIGFRSILSEQHFGSTVAAIENLEVEFIPERFFLQVLQKNPELSFEMLTILAKLLGNAAVAITTLAQKTVRERLAEVLLSLENKLGQDEDGYIDINLTREEMANLIGTATESAIRLISEFRNDGLIEVKGRKIKIHNRDMIFKLARV